MSSIVIKQNYPTHVFYIPRNEVDTYKTIKVNFDTYKTIKVNSKEKVFNDTILPSKYGKIRTRKNH